MELSHLERLLIINKAIEIIHTRRTKTYKYQQDT